MDGNRGRVHQTKNKIGAAEPKNISSMLAFSNPAREHDLFLLNLT
jgi:hypothetical protein